MTKNVYLVEAYNPELQFSEDGFVIALTPLVCFQLDKAGIKYSIIEDYYDAVAFFSQMEEYRLSVFNWIDVLDEFLQKNIKGLDLKLATIHRWYIKGNILDPIYLRCYTLQRLFKALQPTAITYITQRPAEPHLDYKFDNYGRSLYSQIIPIICDDKNIPLTTVLLEPDVKEPPKIKSASQNGNLVTRLKKTLYKSGLIKRLYFIYRCLKSLPRLNKVRQKKLNFFLTTIAQIGEDFIAEALVRGHHFYLLSGDVISKYTLFGTRKYLKIKTELSTSNEYNWEKTANLLANSELVKWVNEKCQLDVSEVVLPRLRHFILTICPDLVSYIKVFGEFYKKTKIDIFFTPAASTLQDYAALAATKSYPQLKTACLVHGDGVYDTRVWSITELQNYDVIISSNPEMKEYYRRLASEIHSSARLYSNPHRLRNVLKIADMRKKQRAGVIKKNRIIYLPTLMMWDERRYESDIYPDTWYYQFQKSLIKYFSTKKDDTFVWKGLPQSEPIYNPIPDFIRDNHFNNIEIATDAFTEHLLTADRVICDLPSTGFYESILVGVPMMSLYHASTVIRKGAVKYFSNLLKSFSDTPEAIKHIDKFLNSEPEQYKMIVDMEEGSIFDILEGSDAGKNR